MTVIAGFNIENHPFMISDLLISVKASPKSHAFRNLPSPIQKFNVSLPANAKYTITNVLQKTVRITDRFILSYAGSVVQAKNAIKHFRAVAASAKPSQDWLDQEIAVLVKDGRATELSLLGYIEGGGGMFCGGYNVQYQRNRKFLNLRAAGTGANDLLEVFGAYRGKLTNRTLTPFEEGCSLALGLTSNLLAKENITGEPQQRAYGGCYEVSFWGDGDFEKITDVLHVHWFFNYEPPGVLRFDLPARLQKMEYHNSTLYVRDLELRGNEHGDIVYIVSEPNTEATQPPKPEEIKPNFSYKWLVSHWYVILPNGMVHYENNVNYVFTNEFKILISEQGSKLEFEIRSDYFDSMAGIVKNIEAKGLGKP